MGQVDAQSNSVPSQMLQFHMLLRSELEVQRYSQFTFVRNSQSSPNLVKTLLIETVSDQICTEGIMLCVYTERLKLLRDMQEIDKHKIDLYFRQTLKGLCQLQSMVGTALKFELNDEMVGLTNGQFKVWFNSNFSQLIPQVPHFNKEAPKEIHMIKRAFTLFTEDPRKSLSPALENKLSLFFASPYVTFIQTIQLVDQHLKEVLPTTRESPVRQRASERIFPSKGRTFLSLAGSVRKQ